MLSTILMLFLFCAQAVLIIQALIVWRMGHQRQSLSILFIVVGYGAMLLRLVYLTNHDRLDLMPWFLLLALAFIALGSTLSTWFAVSQRTPTVIHRYHGSTIRARMRPLP